MLREHGMTSDAAIREAGCPRCRFKFNVLLFSKPAKIYCPRCGLEMMASVINDKLRLVFAEKERLRMLAEAGKNWRMVTER